MPRVPAGLLKLMFLAASVLGAAGGFSAADGPPPKPADPISAEASRFAQNLDYTVSIIVDEYVRPVSRNDLIFAGLKGLYEAARVPVPTSLKADIEAAKSDNARLALLTQTREKLGDPESLRGTAALVASIRAMCKTLDPYTSLITGEELVRVNQEETNWGFGLEFVEYSGNGPLRIKNVLPGSPAQRAGIRPGDLITHINDQVPDVKGLLALDIAKYGRTSNGFIVDNPSPAKEPVELSLERQEPKTTWKTKLIPTTFRAETVWGVARKPNNSWDFTLDRERQIALVRVGSFGQGTAEELELVLTELQAQGIRGLILDLRWNPGGFFNEAVASARLFLGEELIARIKTRTGTMDREYTGKRDVNFLNFPIVVLVNGETSGGAELIAAALQDNHRALVAGQRTLGKASVQTTKALRVANLGIKLTSGTFVRPSGKNLHRFPDSRRTDDWGVRPNSKLEFRVSPDFNRQLREWYQWQTLRPGPSTEVLPLDNPDSDPQRNAAWMALAEKLK